MDPSQHNEEPVRGGCLTAFLIFMIIVNALTAILYIVQHEVIAKSFPALHPALIAVLTLATVVNIFLAIAVWKWKKWGVYGFVIVAIFAFAINMYVGVPVISAFIGLLGPIILALLVRPKWKFFS